MTRSTQRRGGVRAPRGTRHGVRRLGRRACRPTSKNRVAALIELGVMDKPRARIEPPDLSEKGGLKDGTPQRSDDRLFMQLLAFGGCDDVTAVVDQLTAARIDGVLY